jgi:hypothetical protein
LNTTNGSYVVYDINKIPYKMSLNGYQWRDVILMEQLKDVLMGAWSPCLSFTLTQVKQKKVRSKTKVYRVTIDLTVNLVTIR